MKNWFLTRGYLGDGYGGKMIPVVLYLVNLPFAHVGIQWKEWSWRVERPERSLALHGSLRTPWKVFGFMWRWQQGAANAS
jgi:hypothetical protein